MSIEQALEANTAALKEMTAAILGGAKTTSAGGKPSGGKTLKPKVSIDQLTALAKEARAKVGADAYKALLKKQTGVDALKDVPPEKMDDLAAALTEARNGGDDAGDEDDV